MSLFNWIQTHNGVFAALSALASAFFAWSIFRVERGRDLAANQVHAWVTGIASPQYIPEDKSNKYAFRLNLNFSNDSKLPIYRVVARVRTNSKFSDENFNISSKTEIYRLEEDIILGNFDGENVFPISPSEILDFDLRNYLLSNHPYIEGESPILDKFTASLETEITFRDSGGKYWKRKRNGKLRRLYWKVR
jgi:hypothetical protein